MKIKCLLADDNPEALNFMLALCSKHPDLEVVDRFMDGSEFFDAQRNIDYEACFLDIDMPGMSGMELAELLEGKKIIFVSARLDRAWEAYGVEAIDFVPKPVKASRFDIAVEKLRRAVHSPTQVASHSAVFFPTSNGKTSLNTADIRIIRNAEEDKIGSRDKMAIMADGKEVLLKNLSIETLLKNYLPENSFLQIFRSTLINVDHSFTKQNHDTLLFDFPGRSQPVELTIGRSFASQFKKRFPNA